MFALGSRDRAVAVRGPVHNLALMRSLVFADLVAVVGSGSSLFAAIAALVAIVFAKQAANAARETVSEERELRVEEDYREFGRELWALYQAADDCRRMPTVMIENKMRHAQTRLRGVMVTPVRIALDDDGIKRLDIATDNHSNPVDVYSAGAYLIEALRDAWDARSRQ
jgi:hypothetical protein